MKYKSKFGSLSPVENPNIFDAAQQLQKKIELFSDQKIQAHAISVSDVSETEEELELLKNANVVIAMKISSPKDVQFVSTLFRDRRLLNQQTKDKCQFALDCGRNNYAPIVGPYDHANPTLSSDIAPTQQASGKRMMEQMEGLFNRWTSDDFTVALLLYVNQFASNTVIPWVQYSIDATWEKGPIQNAQEFYKMATKCGDCIAKCIQDEECKTCLDKLSEVDTRDQVLSYRTIVSYESELLRDFSFCILQKNNVFGCEAKIPPCPEVKPLQTWRGQTMTKDLAKQILIAHLNDKDDAPSFIPPEKRLQTSWRVSAGANVAYDQFPNQFQIFYTSLNGKDLWYDPVFRVETIDERNVWCKRHYKVRYGKEPGTFYFSVLDNGVTSNEFWTIVDAANDLSWVIFHYAGAASAVGQRYIGGLLCTPDGSLPIDKEDTDRIWKSLKSCGIEPWELFVVNNDNTLTDAGEPPLTFYRDEVDRAKEEKNKMESEVETTLR
eukprot:CAMPEP_0178947058 /NCGR_PEP_ID=MMETSP0789-20121207/4630_1 /TAXON_ID=3005 /ORGANISM="Rhizosolenia setigera, Strain CCMP 1694" /LENGTH=493 /DNA_ID=CAMNT_0020627119 /DNA_START=403 /DNA_END=1884 /DNA_ORIENTATION=+